MKLICTRTRSVIAHRRGTSALELILVLPILILILLMVAATNSIGGKRLGIVFDAGNDNYRQVVSGGRNVSTDPVPPAGFNAVKPELPNRYAYEDPTKTVFVGLSAKNVRAFTFSDKDVLLDPSWHWANYPNNDQAAIGDWFQQYYDESHSAALVTSLGLQPAGPP